MELELEEAFRKRARASGAVGGSSAVGGPDRLSSLPDCLLHTIMSFLKARQAVQTCVLSTRWRHLWRSVPCLDVDFDEFDKKAPYSDGFCVSSDDDDDDDSSSFEDDSDSERWNADPDNHHHHDEDLERFASAKYKNWEDFEDFAVTLMRRCDIAQLDSFRLRVGPSRAPEFGDRVAAGWLRRAMKYCNPGGGGQRGTSSGFWRLRRLHLCHVHLDNHFVYRVSSVCRSLEDLELDGCRCEFQSITSQSLRSLVLKNCAWHNLSEIVSPGLKTLVIDGGGSNDDACVLVILAPALAYLHLAVDIYKFLGGVLIHKAAYVTKAFIHLKGHKMSYRGTKLDGNQFKLLCSISNSTNLELSGVGTRLLGKKPRFHEFKNLRNILLDHCDLRDDFKTLVFFLRSSPILEKVTLRRCEFPQDSYQNIGTHKRNKASSSDPRGLDLLCENVKFEIIYNYGCRSYYLKTLLGISVNLLKSNIKLTKLN